MDRCYADAEDALNGECYVVEQKKFSKILDGRITGFDLLCSGFQNFNG